MQKEIQHILDLMPEAARDTLYARQEQHNRWMETFRQNRPADTTERFRPLEVIPEHLQPGKPYTDFTRLTPDGTEIKLSDLLPDQKLILIDFWASWCAPCLQEMPVIAALHEKYKDHGLTVIGISTESDRRAWLAAIERNRMEWLQLTSRKEDDLEIEQLYGVKSIPHTLIIDGNGNMLYRKLRGEELAQKIDELMSEN
ncbi:MAG: TlpA family protein disulfide reductase [Rikenellaceae bacterium]|nr:TlpA family protein disulfide reductase [Rikenellaceae bacterium]